MQKLFNKSKRKHSDDPGSENGTSKHKKHKDSHALENVSGRPYEKASLEISLRTNSNENGERVQKIANLIRALDEALEEDGMDETLKIIGDDNLSRCLDLRTSLKQKNFDTTSIKSPPASQPQRMSMSHDYQNIPKTISALSLTPWKSSTIPTTMPPPPVIYDPTLEQSVFIHVGCTPGRPTDLNYERLEWIGDAYLYLIACLLISQTFPSLGPGRSSQIREKLVKNVNLSKYSYEYGFDKRAILPKVGAGEKPLELTKIMGDIFEAYIAAVILSDPENGVVRASEWLKDILGMTIAKDIIDEERRGLKMDSPIWRLRGHHEPVQLSDPNAVVHNPKQDLQNKLGSKGVSIQYKDLAPPKKSMENKMPVFTVGVFLDGWGEKNKMLGSGKGMSKKDAGFKAAEMAMANKKMMKVYIEKKKIFDAQMELEKAELEKLDLVKKEKEPVRR